MRFFHSSSKHHVPHTVDHPSPNSTLYQDNLGYYLSGWFLKGNIKLEIYAKNNLVKFIALKCFIHLPNEKLRTMRSKITLRDLAKFLGGFYDILSLRGEYRNASSTKHMSKSPLVFFCEKKNKIVQK